MPKYKVELISKGGKRIPPIILEASSPNQAKTAAETQANAQAQASMNTKAYTYKATNVTQA